MLWTGSELEYRNLQESRRACILDYYSGRQRRNRFDCVSFLETRYATQY